MAETRIAWLALSRGITILTSDGKELGRVHDVIADEQQDILSGVTFKDGILGDERFVPAELIDEMTEQRVRLRISAAEAEERLRPYEG